MAKTAEQKKSRRDAIRARMLLVRAGILLAIAQVCMSSGGIFGRYALDEIAPLQVAALRMAAVSIPLGVRFLWVRQPRQRKKLEWKLFFAGVALAVVFGAWTGSLARLSVGTSTLLTCTPSFFNGLYEAVILKRPTRWSFWAAFAVALGGVMLMVRGSTGGGHPVQGQEVLGVCLASLSSLAMATYYILVRQVAKKEHYGTIDVITRTYGWAALLLAVFCLAVDRSPLPPWDHWYVWGGILGLALVTQGMGHSLQNAALSALRPSIVGFAGLSEPLIAAALAIALFGERITWSVGLGGAALLLALGWVMVGQMKEATPA